MNDNQMELIEKIVSLPNAYEFICELMEKYSRKYPEQSMRLISLIDMFISDGIRHTLDQKTKLHNNLINTICMLYKNDKKYEIKDNISFIAALLSCEVLCPNGYEDSKSIPLLKRYFVSMLEYLKNHKQEYDEFWTKEYGHDKYIKKILEEA